MKVYRTAIVGARMFFESARLAFGTRDFIGSDPRCNVDVWAERGRFWWRENGTWGYHLNGMAQPFVAPSQFNDYDMPAQTRFTQAIADWLDDDNKPHHCRLELALRGFDAILSAYRSALWGCRVSYDTPLADAEWERLREKVCHCPYD